MRDDCDSAADVRLFLHEDAKPGSRSAENWRRLSASCGCEGNFDQLRQSIWPATGCSPPRRHIRPPGVRPQKRENINSQDSGIEKPHAILYRDDLKRLIVTDGEAGDLKMRK